MVRLLIYLINHARSTTYRLQKLTCEAEEVIGFKEEDGEIVIGDFDVVATPEGTYNCTGAEESYEVAATTKFGCFKRESNGEGVHK